MILKVIFFGLLALAAARILLIPLRRMRRGPSGPEITSWPGALGGDLFFAIGDSERLGDGSRTLRLHGMDEGRRVGLIVVLGADWMEFSMGEELPLAFRGSVALQSLGVESDALLGAMDRVWGTGLQPKRMRASASVAAVSLAGDPRDPFRGSVRIKLFFEGLAPVQAEDEDTPELFVHIDAIRDRAALVEKDTAFRAPLVQALTGR